VGPNISLQEALTDAQTSGNNTEIFLPAGYYMVSSVASLATAASQNVTISGAGRGTRILATSAGALSIMLGASCSFKIANLLIIQNGTGNGSIGLIVTSATTNNGPVTIGTSTTHFTVDGSSSFPEINNKFVNCFFWNRETGLLIGDDTNSYVQGVSVLNCNPVTCVKWYLLNF